jgi:dethiobiotin synthetase
MKKIFITGIGTDVGKTVVSAIVVEALKADYWKPIQAGELENSDADKIRELISNKQSNIFAHSYALKTPMSPDAAAAIDGVTIHLKNIVVPKTLNNLVIEGAGGILVPLNEKETILDLIYADYHTILVSRHYLGSINHTLLSVEMLKKKGLRIAGIIFVGARNPTSETSIEKFSNVPVLGRIDEEKIINKKMVKRYADLMKPILENL